VIDWPAVTTTIAGRYDTLSDGAGHTLRASHDVPPDGIVCPCAVTILRSLRDVEVYAGWITGTAVYDVMVLLDPLPDVPRRTAALLRWVGPATIATLGAVQLSLPANISAAVPSGTAVELAGESDVYAGMPYDMVRVSLDVRFRAQVTVA
jgi:hypothetical protein